MINVHYEHINNIYLLIKMSSINKTLLDLDKIQIIDTIIEHYPELKKDRTHIINIIFEKIERVDRYILDKLIINNKTYYRDRDNLLIDSDLNFAGIVSFESEKCLKYIIRPKLNRISKYNIFLSEIDFLMDKKK